MFGKRGQVTVFVIIGIVIVLGIVLFMVYRGGESDRYFGEAGVAEGVSSIDDYMQDCLTYVAESSLNNVMLQGGFYTEPSQAEDFGEGAFLPYYYYEGKSYVPSLESIESEIAKSISDSAPSCVDIAEFTNYDVSYTKVEPAVDIVDNEVRVVVDMPIKIESQGHAMILDMKDNPISIPSKLKGMHNVAEYFVTDISDDSEYCVNCLGDLAIGNNVSVDVLGLNPTTSSVILSEDMDGTMNSTYYFFLVKFPEGAFDELKLPVGYDVN